MFFLCCEESPLVAVLVPSVVRITGLESCSISSKHCPFHLFLIPISSSVRMLPCPGLEALCSLLRVSCPTCTLHAQFISPEYGNHFLLLSQILTHSICHLCLCLEWCFPEALKMALLSLCLLEVYTPVFFLVILF